MNIELLWPEVVEYVSKNYLPILLLGLVLFVIWAGLDKHIVKWFKNGKRVSFDNKVEFNGNIVYVDKTGKPYKSLG